MSVEVDSGGALPGLPEHTTHHPSDFSSVTSEWLRKQLDGPTNASFPFDVYGGPFTEEIMDAYSILPDALSSQYDPAMSQLPFSFDNDNAGFQMSQTMSFMPHTTNWQGNNIQTVFSDPPFDPRYISPKALTSPPEALTNAHRSAQVPPSPIDLTTGQTAQPNSQTTTNNLYGPFGYVSSSGISSTGTSTPATQAGFISSAHTTALPNASHVETTVGSESQSTTAPIYTRPIFGNDPAFRHNSFRPSSEIARGVAKVEAFQDRAVYHNVFYPNDHIDLNIFAPPSKAESQITRKAAKRSHETAGLASEDNNTTKNPSPAKKARTTASKSAKKDPLNDDPEVSASTPITPPSTSKIAASTSHHKRTKSKSSTKPSIPSNNDTTSSTPPPTATSTTSPPRSSRPPPKSAEERRKRHNESEKRRRDYFKLLRERLFGMVPAAYEIKSKTIGAKHRAVVKWAIELRRGNLRLLEEAENLGLQVEGVEGEGGLGLKSKGGKEELRRQPKLFFEMDNPSGLSSGEGGTGAGAGGGRGEDAETGLKRILGTMEAIKREGGGAEDTD
ncbi:MAG: hypothetical protein Q9160_006769 [Pyrenula sp. 1 TL-2023]